MSASKSKLVLDVNNQNFQTLVVEASKNVPILVDFWAPWCGPCRDLTPVLEKLVVEFDGALVLAKVNIDENQELALQFQIRSIPQVCLFHEGQLTNQFSGNQSESNIRKFLKPYCLTQVDKLFQLAQEKIKNDGIEETKNLLQEILQLEPDHSGADLAIAKILIDEQQPKIAETHLKKIPATAEEYGTAERLLEVIQFQVNYDKAGGEDALRKLIATNPSNIDARLALASCLTVKQEYHRALQELLALVAQDKHYDNDAARKAMLAIFSLVGERSDLADEFRSKLAQVLY